MPAAIGVTSEKNLTKDAFLGIFRSVIIRMFWPTTAYLNTTKYCEVYWRSLVSKICENGIVSVFLSGFYLPIGGIVDTHKRFN